MSNGTGQHPECSAHARGPPADGRLRVGPCWSVAATAERFQVDAKTVRKWRDDSSLRVMPGCGTGRAGPVVHRTARLRRAPAGTPVASERRWGRPISGSRSAWPLRRCRRSSTLRVWAP